MNIETITKYRPSNGSEGEYFMRDHCYKCKHDDGENKLCDIIGKTMAYSVLDDEYPIEWQIIKGEPTCTAFENDN